MDGASFDNLEMKEYLLSLTSGLIGTIVGVWMAGWINRSNRKVAAIERMVSLVYPIGFKSWWQPEPGKPALIFHENYSDLWGAYAALRAALPWWKRKGLDTAWKNYMVIGYYDTIPDSEYSKVFLKGTHNSREEAVEKSSEFIRYLVKLR